MPLTMTCPCGKLLDVDDAAHGKPAQCPKCGNVFIGGSPISTTTAIQDVETEVKVVAPIAPPETSSSVVRSIEKPWFVLPTVYSVMFVVSLLSGAMCLVLIFLPEVHFPREGKQDITIAQMKSLTLACDQFRLKNNRWPKDLKELTERDQNGFQYVEDPNLLNDPWGVPYQYDANGPNNNGRHVDIWTVTPDGVTVGNWPGRR